MIIHIEINVLSFLNIFERSEYLFLGVLNSYKNSVEKSSVRRYSCG